MSLTIMSKLMQGLPLEPSEFAAVNSLLVAARMACETLQENEVQIDEDFYEHDRDDIAAVREVVEDALKPFESED